jgi:hypothetical protein
MEKYPHHLDPKRGATAWGLQALLLLFEGQPEAKTVESLADKVGVRHRLRPKEQGKKVQNKSAQGDGLKPAP